MSQLRLLISADELLAALKESDPEAFIGEQEHDWFVIDGRFNLPAVAARLSEGFERLLPDQPRE